MDMIIKFRLTQDPSYEEAFKNADRIYGLHLEVNESYELEYKNGWYIEITVPAIRASALVAELIQEGWLD